MKAVLDAIIDTEHFNDWQMSLLKVKEEKNGKADKKNKKDPDKELADIQQSLVDILRGSAVEAANQLMKDAWVNEKLASESLPNIKDTVSPQEYLNGLDLDREQAIYKELSESSITRSNAAESRFWFACHMKWLKEGKMGEKAEEYFLSSAKDNESSIKGFLKGVGGIPVESKKFAVDEGCKIARAYWRGLLASEISAAAKEEGRKCTPAQAHAILHNNYIWDILISYSMKKITALNVDRARSALITAIQTTEEADWESKTDKKKKESIESAIKKIGYIGNDYNLNFVPYSKMEDAARKALS